MNMFINVCRCFNLWFLLIILHCGILCGTKINFNSLQKAEVADCFCCCCYSILLPISNQHSTQFNNFFVRKDMKINELFKFITLGLLFVLPNLTNFWFYVNWLIFIILNTYILTWWFDGLQWCFVNKEVKLVLRVIGDLFSLFGFNTPYRVTSFVNLIVNKFTF